MTDTPHKIPDEIRNFFCPAVIPTVFDNSISYYEVLCKLMYKINEILDYIENLEDYANAYTDEQIELLRQELTALINQVDEAQKSNYAFVLSELNQFKSQVDIWLEELENKHDADITEVKNQILQTKNQLEALIAKTDAENRAWTLEQIQQVSEMGCYMESPTKGGQKELGSKVIMDVWNCLKWGIPAWMYDNLHLTAQEFDSVAITACRYDVRAYFFMVWVRDNLYMFSPITGKREHIQTVINELYNLHKTEAITTGEYDAKSLQAQVYDALDATATEYDTSAKTILP